MVEIIGFDDLARQRQPQSGARVGDRLEMGGLQGSYNRGAGPGEWRTHRDLFGDRGGTLFFIHRIEPPRGDQRSRWLTVPPFPLQRGTRPLRFPVGGGMLFWA